MRRSMRPNHANRIPSSHCFLDAETVPSPSPVNPAISIHRLHVGCGSYFRLESGRRTRRSQTTFRDHNTALSWILSLAHTRNPLWVWCHNAGFDLTTIRLWQLFETGELTFDAPPRRPATVADQRRAAIPRGGLLVSDDPPTIIRCYTRGGATVWFVDTLNWFLSPLADLGAAVGLPKLPMPGELATTDDWERYCRRDVEIVEEVVYQLLLFVRDADLGNFRTTAASQAMAWYRHTGMRRPIHLDDDESVKRLERECYYGCRRQIYYQGVVVPPEMAGLEPLAGLTDGVPVLPAGPVYHLDVNGAFPYAMLQNPYPVAYQRTMTDCSPASLLRAMEGCCACAHVRVDSGCDPWPLRERGETMWAIGSFDTCLCGPELIRAIRQGDVKRVYRAQLYTADHPFDSWVESGWRMRLRYRAEGKPLWERLTKLLMNSLHGKFGQRQGRWEPVPDALAPTPWGCYTRFDSETGGYRVYRSVAGWVQARGDGGEHPDSFPAISAYCTAYARERMYQLRWAAGLRHTLYEDTDSLHVTAFGYETLRRLGYVSVDSLGALKIEHEGRTAEYRGVHDYTLGERTVLGGLGRKAWEDSHGLWHQTNFDRLDSHLAGPPPEGPTTEEVTLARPSHPVCGRVAPDGWVEPLLVRR